MCSTFTTSIATCRSRDIRYISSYSSNFICDPMHASISWVKCILQILVLLHNTYILAQYILGVYRTYSTRDQLLNTCTVSAIHIPEQNLRSHAVGVDYHCLQGRSAGRSQAIVVAISSLEVPSICDSAERSPTCARGSRYVPVAKHLLSTSIAC